jgi:hypothetical protein
VNLITEQLYEQINVFKKNNDQLYVYRCFKSLSQSKFYVQSQDVFYKPIDRAQIVNSQLQLFDLFFDDDIEQRCLGFDSLEAAISAFDEDFD